MAVDLKPTPARPGDVVYAAKSKGGAKKDTGYEVVFTARDGLVVVGGGNVSFLAHDDVAAAPDEEE